MVAAIQRNPHFRQLPPADFDPGEPLQKAFNPTERKLFEHKKAGVIQHPNGRKIREYLLVDNYGNHWITYLAVCLDGEVYQWPTDRNAYAKPSIVAEHGGFTADLFDKYRVQAFKAFDRIDAGIRIVRKVASDTAGRVIDGAKLMLELPPVPDLSAKPTQTVQIGNPEAHK